MAVDQSTLEEFEREVARLREENHRIRQTSISHDTLRVLLESKDRELALLRQERDAALKKVGELRRLLTEQNTGA